jgi:N4-gp56 family major capsid protein
MAKVAYPGGATSVVTAANAGIFIPELWSDEIVAAYKKNLVMANLVNKMSFKGKKGDTLYIPKPTRGSATAKAANTAVTIQADSETNKVTVSINKHYEYSRLIEDIAEVQALASMRRFYTDDAGYALATQVDNDLLQLGRDAQSGGGAAGTIAYEYAVIGSDGATAYTGTNEAAITDLGLRKVIQTLDDADVPMDNRSLVIPPVARNVMMGLARFTEQAFVGEVGGGNTIRNGQIGDVYGIKVYVSTNCETATGAARIGLMFHKDAFVFAEQVGVRSQTQYKQEYLGTLFTSDTLYGVAEMRDEAAVAIAMTA